ncbi:MAG: hypothetical protein H6573_08780 [Lewinellaceae bacterium]|nr:hypothetical protein [Phaeodactylibacter sp.]MCB9347596.1 hypothetical protein [Lewinellaceae bacterium]
MKLIIGMAKSNLKLNDGQSRKLELDFLRLAYAVQRVEEVEKGYLIVATDKSKKRAEGWKEKYQLDGEVEVLVAKLNENELKLLKSEKQVNIEGMLEGTTGKGKSKRSIAKLGKSLLEDALKQYIEEKEATTVWEGESPLGIQWDYCGQSDS